MTQFRIDHAELVMRDLDAHRQRLEDERAKKANRTPRVVPALDAGGRRQYAQQIRRTLEMCVYPLKLIKVNPIPRVWLPRVPVKAKCIPYPDEERAVLEDTSHPVAWRIYFGALTRLGSGRTRRRASPSRRSTSSVGSSCSTRTRPTALGLPPTGRTSAAASGIAERWQSMLEASTKKKGIYRPDLFKKSAKRMKTRAHDLRGMFTTYALANGMTETWVMDRTGHRSSTMVNLPACSSDGARVRARGPSPPSSRRSPRSRSRAGAAFAAPDAAPRVVGSSLMHAAPPRTSLVLPLW